MPLTRPQIVIIVAVVFVVLFFVGVFTGVLPGTRQIGERPPDVTLSVWGIDERTFIADSISDYEALRPNVRVEYRQINPATYEQDFVNALAANRGPDVIMFHNTWLPKHGNKIISARDAGVSEEDMNISILRRLFPDTVEQNFAPDGRIFALPLYIDSLALFYNIDSFDRAGIAAPPRDWLAFQNIIPQLRVIEGGRVTRAAAAIGGSNETVENGSDILMALMLQAGTQMTNAEFTQATFASTIEDVVPGLEALRFYTKFTDPRDEFYTWGDHLGSALNNFAQGNAAMMFAYANQREAIRERNPFLRFRVAEIPQPTDAPRSVTLPNYWGLAVTNNSANPAWAWDFILYATANEDAVEKYVSASNRPPALRAVIARYREHPDLGVFARQALFARSWPQIDNEEIRKIFSNMIGAVTSGQLEPPVALTQAEREVTELMRR